MAEPCFRLFGYSPQQHLYDWGGIAPSAPVLPGIQSVFLDTLEKTQHPKAKEETQEEKKRNIQSPLGQHQDRVNLQQLLHPDNLCKIFNELSHLLSLAPLEDVTSIQTPLDSTGYVRKSSPSKFPALSSVPGGELLPASLLKLSPPSSFSLPPNKVMPSADLLSPSPLSDSLPPEPLPPLDSKATEDPLPPSSLSLPASAPHPTQETDTLLPQDATVPVVSSPAGLSTFVPVGGMDHSST
uniref:spermatogenesis-associated protein 31D3-like n=1 Tax=Ictidomys tridecemlineatus TaxID=43179 RepID=UPI001A9DC070|nr:spermatogenesis-associated protein 31D3-like [Ictidomys tridecemlineatus]